MLNQLASRRMTLLRYFLPIFFISNFVFAEEDISAPPTPAEKRIHCLSVGADAGSLSGIYFSYAQPIHDHWTLGARLSAGVNSSRKQGGDLDNAQYYKESMKQKTSMAELNATYHFRKNGHNGEGFLLRGGLGYSKNEMTADWTRYDRDPAFITIGDDKRYRDSKAFDENWSSMFARLGAHYQFTWDLAIGRGKVDHFFELGGSATFFANQKKLEYTKPDGNLTTYNSVGTGLNVEISYTVAF